jgi:hypothetical protein
MPNIPAGLVGITYGCAAALINGMITGGAPTGYVLEAGLTPGAATFQVPLGLRPAAERWTDRAIADVDGDGQVERLANDGEARGVVLPEGIRECCYRFADQLF